MTAAQLDLFNKAPQLDLFDKPAPQREKPIEPQQPLEKFKPHPALHGCGFGRW